MREARPDDILTPQSGNNHQDKRIVTQSSAKVDEGVKTLEDKVITWQELVNYWREKVTQKENLIIMFFVLVGMFFSWAVNRCTGNFDISTAVYILSALIVFVIALLLIAPGALPLKVLVGFATSAFIGHYAMMWLVAIDGHFFKWFTSDTCRYPFSVEMLMVFLGGACAGYIGKSFEEIRAARGK